MKKRATITEVAKRARTSIGTVSRVLNGYSVSPEKRGEVLRAISALKYRPNMFATGIRGTRRNCIGILIQREVDPNTNPWLEKIVLHLLGAVNRRGFRCMMEYWDGREEVPRLLDAVDGCMLLGHYPERFFEAVGREHTLPLVSYNEKVPYSPGASVGIDYGSAIKDAVKHLLALGHRNIGFVTRSAKYPSFERRWNGYREALAEFGIPVREELIADTEDMSESNYERGRLGTRKLLEVPDVSYGPTAFLYVSDFLAMGGLRGLRDAGRRVPEDASVVGFDDVTFARLLSPSLSSICHDYDELAGKLTELIEGFLAGAKPAGETTLQARFLPRESVSYGPLRRAEGVR